jgi:hypothetical protein
MATTILQYVVIVWFVIQTIHTIRQLMHRRTKSAVMKEMKETKDLLHDLFDDLSKDVYDNRQHIRTLNRHMGQLTVHIFNVDDKYKLEAKTDE